MVWHLCLLATLKNRNLLNFDAGAYPKKLSATKDDSFCWLRRRPRSHPDHTKAIPPVISEPSSCQQSELTGCYGIYCFDNMVTWPYPEFPIKFSFPSFEKLPKLQFFLFRNSLSLLIRLLSFVHTLFQHHQLFFPLLYFQHLFFM